MKPGIMLIALMAAWNCCSCCPGATAYSGDVLVSSDGKWIAYLWSECIYIPVGPEPVKTQETVSVCWARIADPKKISSRRVATWGMDKRGYSLASETHLVFSPKAARLAVIAPSSLLLLDLATSKWRTQAMEGQSITSLGWLDEDRFGYVTVSSPKDAPTEHTFCEQRYDQAMTERRIIHRDPNLRHSPSLIPDWPQEFWSPDGRYVFFFCDALDSEFVSLMTVATGEIRKLPGPVDLDAVSWSRDSTRVAWLTSTTDGEYHMFLLNVREPHPVDLTQDLRKAFGKPLPHSPQFVQAHGDGAWFPSSIEPLWTPDGRFIVGSNLGFGGYLIQPDPWAVRLIGRRLDPNADYFPRVRGQAAENILVADWSPNEATVDYEGKILKVLGQGGQSGWTVLPGGKQAVCVMPGNKLVVKSLE